ncbi:MAG: hypothetical protein RSC20_07230, partial [Clostridiales bacterium]
INSNKYPEQLFISRFSQQPWISRFSQHISTQWVQILKLNSAWEKRIDMGKFTYHFPLCPLEITA